jgi:hypothetical protein
VNDFAAGTSETGATDANEDGAANLRSRRGRLFRKYVALFVMVVSAALIASGLLQIFFAYKEQTNSLVRFQREQAQAAADKIGQFIREIEGQIGWTTQLPWSAGTFEQHRFDAQRLLRQVPAITEVTMIDGNGRERRANIDRFMCPCRHRRPRRGQPVGEHVFKGFSDAVPVFDLTANRHLFEVDPGK